MYGTLQDFYQGQLFWRYDLEREIEYWQSVVDEYERNDVYQGDQYYQDALQTLSALKEALDNLHEYYEEQEDGSLIYIFGMER